MIWPWIVLGSVVVLILLLRILLTRFLRSQIYRAKPPVAGTPADHGLDHQQLWIETDNGRLSAWYIEAEAPTDQTPTLLLFQGGDDVIGELPHLLKYLHDHGFATLAFDYSGNGQSTGEPSADAFYQDSLAAFKQLEQLAGSRPKYLWGFSAGTSRLMSILPAVENQVEGAFLVGPFASLRLMTSDRLSLPEPLLPILVPDEANNLRAIERVSQAPITIIHSEDDELAPFHHARRLLAAGGDNVELVPLQKLKHNDCWQPIHDAYWQPVFNRIEGTD